MFTLKPLLLISLLLMCTVLPMKSFGQTDGFPPDDWMGGAEVDWSVDVPEWDTLNVRSLPNHKSKKIGMLKPGTIVGIDDRADNGWVYIYSDTTGGWVNSTYLCKARSTDCKYLKPSVKSEVKKSKSQIAKKEPSPTPTSSAPKTSVYPSDFSAVDDTILNDVNAWASINGNTSKWLQYDHFYLHEIPKTINSPQMTVLALSYSRQEMALLVQNLFGFVDVAAKAIQEHPDWSAEDIIIEVKNSQLTELEGKQETFIRYLSKNRLSLKLIRARENNLDKRLRACLNHVEKIRPTLRPSEPNKKCVAHIIATGLP